MTIPDTADKTEPLDARLVYLRLVDLMLTADLPEPQAIRLFSNGRSVYVHFADRCDRTAVDRWAAALDLPPAREHATQATRSSGLLDYTTPQAPVALLPGWPVLVYGYVEPITSAPPALSDVDQAAADRIRAAAGAS